MKKTIPMLLAASSLICLSTAAKVQAEDLAILHSKGSVIFEQGEGTVTPVDPGQPDKPVEPTDPTDPPEPGTSGPLSLDFASHWKFGLQKVTAFNKTYFAHPQAMKDGSTSQLYAQVTDVRGSFAGWSLSVKQVDQFKTTDGQPLKGAELAFAGAGKTTSTSEIPASQVTENFTLKPQISQVLLTAKTGEGAGTNVYALGNREDYDDTATSEEAIASKAPVTLSVKAASMRSEQYTCQLEWSLSDVPLS